MKQQLLLAQEPPPTKNNYLYDKGNVGIVILHCFGEVLKQVAGNQQ